MTCGSAIQASPDSFDVGGVKYTHVAYHRDGSRQKSQWSVSPDRERCIFACGRGAKWGGDETIWGLYTPSGRVEELGTRAGSSQSLYVGKFVTAEGTTWHGYPADHQLHTHDRPPEAVASAWIACRLENFTKAKVGKLLQGKRCSLSV